jgi:hypothetical protein
MMLTKHTLQKSQCCLITVYVSKAENGNVSQAQRGEKEEEWDLCRTTDLLGRKEIRTLLSWKK